jgi:hypothetical protein
MAIKVNANDLLGMRLRAQQIEPVPRAGAGVADTVRRLLALQAQDFAQALWAIGVRTPGAVRSDVLAALESGEVVRSLPMRGTLHFVPAEDLGWMLSLTAERSLQAATTRQRTLGLDRETLDRSYDIAAEALAGGHSLDRAGFMNLLESNGVSPEGQRGYHVIFYLTQKRLICWGPPSGTQQALVLVDEWIRAPRELDREEALREFALRYFRGHGPATLEDFAWWTKLTLKDARAGIAAAGGELTELALDDVSYLIGTEEAAASASTSGAMHALPGFDEYLLGYRDRTLPLAAEHSNRIVPGGNGIFLPVIVARGRVVGTWRRAARNGGPIEPEGFAELTRGQATGFDRAAKAYARFTAG